VAEAAAAVEAAVEEDTEPVAEAAAAVEAAVEEAPEPVAEAAAAVEAAVEEAPEPVAEAAAAVEAAVEEAPEPVAEAAAAVEAAVEEAPEPVSTDEASAEAVTEEDIPAIAQADTVENQPAVDGASEESEGEDSDFDIAAAALSNGDYARAWPYFHKLRQESPNEPTYLVGEIASLAGLERYSEAYALGTGLDIDSLEDSADVYRESFESVLVALAENAESPLVRKGYLIEMLDLVEDPERLATLLDEIEEIPLRTPREGELSLLQARHRVAQDDVTEYLIEALSSLSDNPEIFILLSQNLERYPELAPLKELVERLVGASRDEALEAESGAKDLISGGESVEELLEEVDPGEEALVQVFLEHLLPRTGVKVELPSESFEELLAESEPAAFVGALRQALRSVDYTAFFDEIEVLSYDGEEHFILRSSPEPKPTLLFGSNVDDVPPEELRFLVLRELFSMHRRHSHLAHLAAGLDDKLRYTFVKTCLDIHKEAEFQIPDALLGQLSELEGLAAEGGQDPEFRARLTSTLNSIYQATESDSFTELADFLFDGQLHKKWLDPLADAFAAKQTGLVVASFAIARDALEAEDFETLEESGFQWLYSDENRERLRELRFRLQRLWVMPFKALVSDAEE
jgi:tetratricopeptide (TPR) repeat protein